MIKRSFDLTLSFGEGWGGAFIPHCGVASVF